MHRLTFFTKDDDEEPVPIPSMSSMNICLLFKSNKKASVIEMNGNSSVDSNIKNNTSNTNNDVNSDINARRKNSIFKRIFFWICGIESNFKNKNEKTIEEPHLKESKIKTNETSSRQRATFWSFFIKLNLIFQLCICGFMWVFFNKFN